MYYQTPVYEHIYRNISKLENPSEQNYVMTRSGMNRFVQLETKHKTRGGGTELYRKTFYSEISGCKS